MCRIRVEVVVVDGAQLSAPWAAGVAKDGRRVLWVRHDAPPEQVAEGYASALTQCPIRVALQVVSVA